MPRFAILLLSALVTTTLLMANNDSVEAQPGVPTTIQAIYAVPSDEAVKSEVPAAATASLQAVQEWFSSETGGQYPVFNRISGSIDVKTLVLSKTKAELLALDYGPMSAVLQAEAEAAFAEAEISELFVYLEAEQDVAACGYSGSMIVIPMDNCNIRPSSSAQFPYGATYLAAHELTHMLGAVPSCAPNYIAGGHLIGDNRDILFQGARDWDNLMLDPGNDDYYNHGRSDCPDIKDSPILGTWQSNKPGGSTTTTTTTTTTPTTPTGPVFCSGLEATLFGTSGDDVLTGTSGPDVIAGLQGNDVIRGLGGDDVICGGKGNDRIYGGAGFDILFGAQGNDVIYAAHGVSESGREDVRGARMFGGVGNDTIYGTQRWDRMQGGPGADRLYGYEGRDWMRGGGDSDIVDGGPNIDDMHGGNGNDTIIVNGKDSARGGAGARDRCTIASGAQPTLLVSCELR